jgi:hypothetical protein
MIFFSCPDPQILDQMNILKTKGMYLDGEVLGKGK